jgi:tetratricopeptide (TPR) repeat protein
LAAVRRDLDAGLVSDAAVEYTRFENWRIPGGGADLWYSRRLVQLAASRTDVTTRMQALQQAARAALRATETAEDPFNAYYNVAEFYASRNDFARTEQSLRAAISRAPNWFKPHWMLAQVFEAGGRLKEAEAEAAQGVALDGGKHEEVTRTLDQIRAQLRVTGSHNRRMRKISRQGLGDCGPMP